MKRTRKLTIAGRKYTLQRANLDAMQAWGYCDSANAKIFISETLEKDTTLPEAVVELHEVLHAILFETGLSNLMTDKTEESVVTGLALQLHNIGYRK
jgi:hypothetical protein